MMQSQHDPKTETVTIAGPAAMPWPVIIVPFDIQSISVTNNTDQQLFLSTSGSASAPGGAKQTVQPRMIYGFNGWFDNQVYLNATADLVADEYVTLVINDSVIPSPAAVLIVAPLPLPTPPSDTFPSNSRQSVVSYTMVYDAVAAVWTRLRQVVADTVLQTGLGAFVSHLFDPVSSRYNRLRQVSADAVSPTGIPMEAPMLWNGLTFDKARNPSGDGMAATGLTASAGMVWNGVTWDRMAGVPNDGIGGGGKIGVLPMVWNGATFDRLTFPAADGLGGGGKVGALPMVWNGATWDRLTYPGADGFAGNGKIGAIPGVWNGVTYDRARSAYNDGIPGTGLTASGGMVWNGVTWDRMAGVPNDGIGGGGKIGVLPMVWNGATWDRLREPSVNGVAPTGFVGAIQMVYNGATFDLGVNATADGVAATGKPATLPLLYNESSGLWSRPRMGRTDGVFVDLGNQAVALHAFDAGGGHFYPIAVGTSAGIGTVGANRAALTAEPGHWALNHTPGAGVQATATRVGTAGVRHVVRSLVCSVNTFAAGVPAAAFVYVRDGATGVGAILFGTYMSTNGVAGAMDRLELTGLSIVGTPGNAITVEFQAGLGASAFETVYASGYEAA